MLLTKIFQNDILMERTIKRKGNKSLKTIYDEISVK